MSSEVIGRVNAALSLINDPNGANAISKFCKEGTYGFGETDLEAWRKRNKPAHGSFSLVGLEFEQRTVAVRNRDRIRNMVNKLMLNAIGYAGLYYDYADHRIATFL